MSGRDEILASIRTNRPRMSRPLPAIPLFDDHPPASLLAAFKQNLERMGGIFLDPPMSGDAMEPVRARIPHAAIVCSTVPEIAGNFDITGVGVPAGLVRSRYRDCPRFVRRRGDGGRSAQGLGPEGQRRRLFGAAPNRTRRLRGHRRESASCLSATRIPLRALRLPSYGTVRDGRHRRRAHPRCAGRTLPFRAAARAQSCSINILTLASRERVTEGHVSCAMHWRCRTMIVSTVNSI